MQLFLRIQKKHNQSILLVESTFLNMLYQDKIVDNQTYMSSMLLVSIKMVYVYGVYYHFQQYFSNIIAGARSKHEIIFKKQHVFSPGKVLSI
jgi:hypothetical protein